MQEKFNPPENKKFNSSSRQAVESLSRNKDRARRSKVVEETWRLYDQSITPIGSTFIKSLPKEYTGEISEDFLENIPVHGELFKKYIEETLQNKDKKLKAIEFGGPGSRLFKGFSKNFFSKTVGVCLSDIRSKDDRYEDETNNHVVFEGDLFSKKTYVALSKELRLEKFDLIISRMMGPLNAIEKNPAVMQKVIQQWYSLLDNNGIIFVQFDYLSEHNTHSSFKILHQEITKDELVVIDWALFLKKELGDKVEVQVNRGIIRIHKKQGAPEELPIQKETLPFDF